jgi:hypothetical protein
VQRRGAEIRAAVPPPARAPPPRPVLAAIFPTGPPDLT